MKGIQHISLSNQLTRGFLSVLNIEVVHIIGFLRHELLVKISDGELVKFSYSNLGLAIFNLENF
jgi:hypothetical protein